MRKMPSSFSPVRANTVNTSATGADVIHVFCPLRNHRPSRSSARVAIANRSLPASGSVMQIVPTFSPRSIGCSRRSRTSPSANR